MEVTQLTAFEMAGRYPLYFRQALRFIIEIGGEEALARFEHVMSEVFKHNFPTVSDEHETARNAVTDMVADDFKTVRETPDLI